jgi:predicted nucleic acid-binding protein
VILCDTGPLVAAFNEADSDHARCAEFLTRNWSRLVVPSLAVTEICHLLADPQRRGRAGLAAEFCAAIADDELRVIEVLVAMDPVSTAVASSFLNCSGVRGGTGGR